MTTQHGTAHPMWFGPDDRPLFGWLHLPEGRRARGGVVLCLPLGDEERRAYAAFRKLAESLAAAGLAVLRFSYDGTGDSAGTLEDPDRVKAWVASISEAIAVVRGLGVGRVAAVGMRLGATLLTNAAAALDEPLDALVLWDPCANGREYSRYQQALMGTLPGDPVSDDTGFDTPGYFFSSSLIDGLASLDIVPPGDDSTPVLVLARPDRPRRRLERALSGLPVEWSQAHGQDLLLDVPPLSSEVPWSTIGEVTGWVRGRVDGPAVRVGTPSATSATVDVGTDGCAIRERAVWLGELGLFAIITEPGGGGHGPWMTFLNVATEHHIGPGRQWVEMAREWARHGLRSVRVDFSGVGDSPVRVGQAEHVTYAPEWLDDMTVIAAGVSPGDPSDTAWIGLCSGGYGALEAALAVGGRGAFVLNPSLSSPSMNKASAQADRRRKAFRPYPVHLVRLSVHHGRTAALVWRTYQQFAVWLAPLSVPARAVRAGIDVLLVCGPDDAVPLRDSRFWRYVGEPRLRRTGRFELAVVPLLDHVLLFSRGRRTAVRILTDHVLRRYGDRAADEGLRPAGAIRPTALLSAVSGTAEEPSVTDPGASSDDRRPSAPAAR
jgi:alpha-beta hydrolase superfamily lysophospholipase